MAGKACINRMGFRRKGREYALQLLFESDIARGVEGRSVDGAVGFASFWSQRKATPEVRAFAEALVRGVNAHASDIDTIVNRHARHWSLERMAAVDRNVLRVAVYELCYGPDVPPRVVLNEAIDIAKKYGSEESGSFVNGVLDDIMKTEAAVVERGPSSESEPLQGNGR